MATYLKIVPCTRLNQVKVIYLQTGPAKMMYDIKFDKNRMSCLLFRQNSKLYNLTTKNCVSQKI